MKQDISRIFTPSDLERKYDLTSISENKLKLENQEKKLLEVENENNNILNSIIINLGDLLENQGEISLWFFDGEPTLENETYIDWDNPIDHEGDIYYDRETGYTYVFENNQWNLNSSSELMQAMALSNADVGSEEHERKVFFDTPIPPYNSGDWYVKNGDLYICQISKPSGEIYDKNDFIIAVKYTDDTKANEVNGQLQVIKGSVLTIEESLDYYSREIENTTTVLNGKIDSLEDQSQINADNVELVKQQLSQVQQTAEELSINITNITQNGVNKVVTSTGFVFDESGLNISKEGQEMSSLLDNDGLVVKSYDTEVLTVRSEGVNTENLTVRTYLTTGRHRIEKFTDEDGNLCTGFFWVGD